MASLLGEGKKKNPPELFPCGSVVCPFCLDLSLFVQNSDKRI